MEVHNDINMYHMFNHCTKLQSVNLSYFKGNNIIDMREMHYYLDIQAM